MKKVKSALLILAALALAFSMISCGSDKASSDGASSASSTASSDTQSTDSTGDESDNGSDSGNVSAEESTHDAVSSAVDSQVTSQDSTSSGTSSAGTDSSGGQQIVADDNFSVNDQTDTWGSSAIKVTLNGSSASVSGSGASFADKKLTIKSAGTYVLSGTLSDGQIYIDVDKASKVQLVLNGVNITCSTSACIYADSSDKVIITVAAGTTNTLTDASVYKFPSASKTKPNACIFSDDDLTINGKGTLTVNAKYNNGIGTDNDLKVINTKLTVNAVNNSLKGDSSFSSKGATVSLTSTSESGDGIKVDNETRADKGYVYIESGNFTIKAGDDGIQAVRTITVTTGAKISVDCEGNSLNCVSGKTYIDSGCITEV